MVLGAITLLLVGGCQTVANRPAGLAASSEQPIVDPCAMRLHDIGGAILMYYALNRRMPMELKEASLLSQSGDALKLTCPVSGRPYVYNPTGLQIPGTNKRVIVYDAAPVHDGHRNCLIMPMPRRNQGMSTDVKSVPEAVFETFIPIARQP